MTAAMLKRLAAGYGWTPKGWHLALAEHIPPMAVIGIFRHAVYTINHTSGTVVLSFHSPELVERAKAFRPYVSEVLGAVEIEGPRYAEPHKGAHATPKASGAARQWRKQSGEGRHDG